MLLHRSLAAFLLPLLFVPALFAQDDEAGNFRLQPSIGLGAGMFAFYGDIGNSHDGYNPLLARVGYDLRAGTALTDWLDVSLFVLHGRLGANERGATRNLNFQSRITTGGFQFSYNFLHLLNPDRVVEPWISLGFESVEFLSKTDLLDAQGRAYHYWSDGTIRDIAEDAPNAGDAILLERDHYFESDIRELDLDGFGKYDERSWAVPVGIGARMRLGGGWDLKLGATMHYTLTDLIDGVTEESMDERAGDARNDRFLYSSFSVSYAFKAGRGDQRMKNVEPELTPEQIDLLVLNDDEDGDGVTDFNDGWPNTPAGAKVDSQGKPLDSTDGDGVADVFDDEPGTAAGAPVNDRGVAIGDEEFLKAWLNFIDSGNVNLVSSRVESLDLAPRKPAVTSRKIYVVQVGSEVQGLTEEQMQKLLSIPDLRTVEHGDTISFVVGGYDDLPEAIRRQLQLQKEDGVTGTVMAEQDGHLLDATAEAEAARAAMGEVSTGAAAPKDVVVRVQLGAFRGKLGRDIFAGITDLVVLKGDDGLTRYYTGSFTDVNPAATHKVTMLKKGFSGAFLVAFKDGRRVSLQEAGAKLTGPEDLSTIPSGGVDKTLVKYRVQVGTFAGNVPTEVMTRYIEIGNVEPVTSIDAVRYYYGAFATRAEADAARDGLRGKGLEDAFVVGMFGSNIISADDADRLLAEP